MLPLPCLPHSLWQVSQHLTPSAVIASIWVHFLPQGESSLKAGPCLTPQPPCFFKTVYRNRTERNVQKWSDLQPSFTLKDFSQWPRELCSLNTIECVYDKWVCDTDYQINNKSWLCKKNKLLVTGIKFEVLTSITLSILE